MCMKAAGEIRFLITLIGLIRYQILYNNMYINKKPKQYQQKWDNGFVVVVVIVIVVVVIGHT